MASDHTGFEELFGKYYPDAALVNPHAGLNYYFGNAALSMLYTPDLRYTVLIQWVTSGFQSAYYMNKKGRHGLDNDKITQGYFEKFLANVAAGTSQYATLYGYDGVNTVTNETGMVRYLGSDNTSPMITVFTLENGGVSLTENAPLYAWLENPAGE